MGRTSVASIVVLSVLLLAPAAAAGQGTAVPQGAAAEGVADTRQFEELVRLASERLQRGLLIDEDDEDARRPLFAEAERYARAAAELRPDEAEGWFLTAASIGLQAQYESTRQQVRMGGEMWSLATTALERDPDHAGAHHVLGRLNLEAMSLSGFARLIATHLYGSAMLRQASWQQAEEHLRRAVEIEPHELYHRLWLARFFAEHGEDDDARSILERIVASPLDTALDSVWKSEAAEDLERL